MVTVVTGDSQEEVLIFRDTQTHMHHNIYINIAIVVIMVIKLIIANADIIAIIFSKNFSWVAFPTILSFRDALNIAPNKRHQRTLTRMPTRDINTKVHFNTKGALEIIVYY